jgi:hypothetical protein
MTVHVPESRIRRDAAAHRMMEAVRTGEGVSMAWIDYLVADAAAERGASAGGLPKRSTEPSSPPFTAVENAVLHGGETDFQRPLRARRENDMNAAKVIFRSFAEVAIAMAIFWTVAIAVLVFAATGFGIF